MSCRGYGAHPAAVAVACLRVLLHEGDALALLEGILEELQRLTGR